MTCDVCENKACPHWRDKPELVLLPGEEIWTDNALQNFVTPYHSACLLPHDEVFKRAGFDNIRRWSHGWERGWICRHIQEPTRYVPVVDAPVDCARWLGYLRGERREQPCHMCYEYIKQPAGEYVWLTEAGRLTRKLAASNDEIRLLGTTIKELKQLNKNQFVEISDARSELMRCYNALGGARASLPTTIMSGCVSDSIHATVSTLREQLAAAQTEVMRLTALHGCASCPVELREQAKDAEIKRLKDEIAKCGSAIIDGCCGIINLLDAP